MKKATSAGRILSGQQRRHLVDAVALYMRRARPTAWRWEAAVRHGLRASLCLTLPTSWALADAEANAVVREALARIGATRKPPGDDNLDPWDNCKLCGDPLESPSAHGYCSSSCEVTGEVFADAGTRLWRYGGDALWDQTAHAYIARQMGLRHSLVEGRCRNPRCGRTFWAHQRQKFCSSTCYVETRQTRQMCECAVCRASFLQLRPTHLTCSAACRVEYQRRQLGERTCQAPGCGKRYRAYTSRSKFCSPECRQKSPKRRKPIELNCLWCGEPFSSVRKDAQYCSRRHSALAGAAKKQARKRDG